MTPAAFVMELKRRFPRAKLTAGQEAAFCSQVSRFRPDMELADTLWEHVQTVWPSGADIAKHARRSSGQTDRRSKAHAWSETDCRHCGGEGRITLFGKMLYGTQGAMDEFHVAMPKNRRPPSSENVTAPPSASSANMRASAPIAFFGTTALAVAGAPISSSLRT